MKIAKLLINAGACLRCFDEEGMTPLHFAAMEGSLAVAQYLFEVGKYEYVAPISSPVYYITWNQLMLMSSSASCPG